MARKRLAALGALAFSTGACAASQYARFEDEGARLLLTTLAGEAGLRLANPEVISGRLDAVYGNEAASTLFARFAGRMGYEMHVDGDQVWLQRSSTARA